MRSSWGYRVLAAASACALVAAALVANGTAGASPSWSTVASPNAVGVQRGERSAISCVSATDCLAVGDTWGLFGPATAAEQWNGTQWTPMSTPDLGAGWTSTLSGVACAQANHCFAVGGKSLHVNQVPPAFPLLEQWDGTRWSVETVPLPGVATSTWFGGISCGAPTSCIAVGGYDTSNHESGRLIEQWNGTTWSPVSSPSPSARHDSSFSDVSCFGSGNCTAVGGEVDATGHEQSIAEHWNGTAWSIEALPTGADFGGVITCPDVWHCMTVGGSTAAFASGGHWTVIDPPSGSPTLTGVACVTASDCVASGVAHATTSGGAAMMRWENGTWSRDAVTSPGSTYDTLYAVACAGHACQSVGEVSGPGPLYRRGQGTSWIQVKAEPTIGKVPSDLTAVTCPASTTCIAVGSSSTAPQPTPFAAKWDGTSWRAIAGTSAGVTADEGGELDGIACFSATNCLAVGRTEIAPTRAFALRWNGTHWARLTVPLPSGASSTALRDVACISATDCTAVGSADRRALIDHWNGTAWSVQGASVTKNAAELDAVTCPTSTCIAVGAMSASGRMFAVQATGGTWSAMPMPSAKVETPNLEAVSCASPQWCMATGLFEIDFGGATTAGAMRWNGSAWTNVSVAQPPDNNYEEMIGVVCTSSSNCWGVGSDDAGALIDHWNGTAWSTTSAPPPTSGNTTFNLAAIACTGPSPCFAVGTAALRYG
ncbi:MAG TPA: hypothetical protein VGO03_02400 [Acidimicrobiia bacterium]|jgi:hypothetical protein